VIKISIVTATFNRIKKLKSLYQNLKNQKNKFFFELEWVVIVEQNDFKTIHFLKSISEFKVKIVINKHYKKFSSLIKQGIDNTAGDYISVVGDDDFFFKNSLEIVVKKILSNNN
jgi:glycosyltransferase involved in cell wall biosynthesis